MGNLDVLFDALTDHIFEDELNYAIIAPAHNRKLVFFVKIGLKPDGTEAIYMEPCGKGYALGVYPTMSDFVVIETGDTEDLLDAVEQEQEKRGGEYNVMWLKSKLIAEIAEVNKKDRIENFPPPVIVPFVPTPTETGGEFLEC